MTVISRVEGSAKLVIAAIGGVCMGGRQRAAGLFEVA
jgi:enoyl-CoA hydratase/carnithine racemase